MVAEFKFEDEITIRLLIKKKYLENNRNFYEFSLKSSIFFFLNINLKDYPIAILASNLKSVTCIYYIAIFLLV